MPSKWIRPADTRADHHDVKVVGWSMLELVSAWDPFDPELLETELDRSVRDVHADGEAEAPRHPLGRAGTDRRSAGITMGTEEPSRRRADQVDVVRIDERLHRSDHPRAIADRRRGDPRIAGQLVKHPAQRHRIAALDVPVDLGVGGVEQIPHGHGVAPHQRRPTTVLPANTPQDIRDPRGR